MEARRAVYVRVPMRGPNAVFGARTRRPGKHCVVKRDLESVAELGKYAAGILEQKLGIQYGGQGISSFQVLPKLVLLGNTDIGGSGRGDYLSIGSQDGAGIANEQYVLHLGQEGPVEFDQVMRHLLENDDGPVESHGVYHPLNDLPAVPGLAGQDLGVAGVGWGVGSVMKVVGV